MGNDFLQNPHDRMFRELFTRLDSAAGFLREVIPRAVAERCSWEELQIVPGTWVDEEFNEFESDLLYRVPMQGGELGLYVLLEHQSTPDRWMPLRLLIYMTRIWQEMRKQGTTDGWLAPVMPIVVYQGARQWEVPTSLGELFALSDEARAGLAPFLPAFEYALFDLSRVAA
ncbi:transposase, partial [bacterium]|nr:transposase [bacterium]